MVSIITETHDSSRTLLFLCIHASNLSLPINGFCKYLYETPPPHTQAVNLQFLYRLMDAAFQNSTQQSSRVAEQLESMSRSAHAVIIMRPEQIRSPEKMLRLLRMPAFKHRRCEVLFLLERPDWLFERHCRLAVTPSSGLEEVASFMSQDSICRPDRLMEVLAAELGRERIHLVPLEETKPGIMDVRLLRELCDRLRISPIPWSTFHKERPLLRPESWDLWKLLRRLIPSCPTWNDFVLLDGLREAEKKLGLPFCWRTSPEARRAVLDLAAPGNERLSCLFMHEQPLFAKAELCGDEQWERYRDDPARFDPFLKSVPEKPRRWLLSCLDANEAILTSPQRDIWQRLKRMSAEHGLTPRPRKQFNVAVLTLTRNQEGMIAQTIESVLGQQTDFSLQHFIVDDASTDKTAEIIAQYAARYPQIKTLCLRKKQCGLNVTTLFSRCRSPYVALCDGDDYFSDPLKLQTQVDFMEAHPQCGLCFHPVKVIYEDGSGRERLYPPLEEMPRGVREFYYLSDLLRVNFIQTNSVMYRWRFTQGLPEWFVPDLVPGDWYWHLLHAERGKIGFINKVMSVYRRHTASLFYASEISPKANRLKHGLSELRTYDVINRHFNGRYAKVLQSLANNVFANLLEHSMQTGEDTLLTVAKERFPELAREFFAEVKIVRVPGTRT